MGENGLQNLYLIGSNVPVKILHMVLEYPNYPYLQGSFKWHACRCEQCIDVECEVSITKGIIRQQSPQLSRTQTLQTPLVTDPKRGQIKR